MRWLVVAAAVFLMGCQSETLRHETTAILLSHVGYHIGECVSMFPDSKDKQKLCEVMGSQLDLYTVRTINSWWKNGSFRFKDSWLDLKVSVSKLVVSTKFLCLETDLLLDDMDGAWVTIEEVANTP